LDLAHQLLAHVEAADEMGRDADFGEAQHQELADAVVEHALAGDRAALLVVEGAGVVLEVLHDGAGFRPLEQHLGLALEDLAAPRKRGSASSSRGVVWSSRSPAAISDSPSGSGCASILRPPAWRSQNPSRLSATIRLKLR